MSVRVTRLLRTHPATVFRMLLAWRSRTDPQAPQEAQDRAVPPEEAPLVVVEAK